MAISDEEFETVKELLVSAATYAESAHRNIEDLRAEVAATIAAQANTQTQLDRLGEKVETLVTAQANTQTQLDRLDEKVETLVTTQANTQLQLDALASQFTAFVAQGTADRAAEAQARDEYRQQMSGLQAESRNLLRLLMERQNPSENGSID